MAIHRPGLQRFSGLLRIIGVGAILSTASPSAICGDILRGGAVADPSRRATQARSTAGAEAAAARRKIAQDRLARTSQVINALRNANVRQSAGAAVPNGLVPGGLQVATGANARWDGANSPTQKGNLVNITQTDPTAVLHWETFNVGAATTVNFDQSAGRSDASKWIAFNKVFDPSTAPSRILGQIRADGQVYIVNRNGIIFESGSQVNARGLVASSLPINDNLIELGLLNNRDAQFLFSGLDVPGGSDGTPAFVPEPPNSTGRYGDVIVEAGASLLSPVDEAGSGGRIMLVGANVVNEGVIETPGGQAVLAAGLQVGIQAHDQDDPSLRGLDVFVGNVGDYAGKVTNAGLIEARTGSILVTGKTIEQLGALVSSTTVNLNGRIDLLASYDAVGNPNFDNSGQAGSGGPTFLYQRTGTVNFGPSSVTRILPGYEDESTIAGSSLPESSQINVTGENVTFGESSILMANSGDVTVRAGTWPYKDADGNRTALDASGSAEAGLPGFISGSSQIFFFDRGNIRMLAGSLIDVSGTTEAFVPLAQHVLEVQLRGAELADSPLLRDSELRGIDLVVDLRKSGIYNGRQWFGTPLGDLSGLLNITERDVSQLTTRGGTVTMQSGGDLIIEDTATIDVSGGYEVHEGGRVQTSRLRRGRHLISIHDATPDVTYDEVYDGQTSATSEKWGVTDVFMNPLAPVGGYTESESVAGSAGGTISLTSPRLTVRGELMGRTIKGPGQLDSPPPGATLELAFFKEKRVDISASNIRFIPFAPSPPTIRIIDGISNSVDGLDNATVFTGTNRGVVVADSQTIAIDTSLYTEAGGGFGRLVIDNREGKVIVAPGGRGITLPAFGELTVDASVIEVVGDIRAPSGTVDFTSRNFSTYLLTELQLLGLFGTEPSPEPVPGRGQITVRRGVEISVAGQVVDERLTGTEAEPQLIARDGGTISMEAYAILLEEGSTLDASGGVHAHPDGEIEVGDGGTIAILSGQDPSVPATIGGELKLDATLKAYGGEQGGSLILKANTIVIGGAAPAGGLELDPSFFDEGGFQNFTIIGIGARDDNGAAIAALEVMPGTRIAPQVQTLLPVPFSAPKGNLASRAHLKPVGLRPPADIALLGVGADDDFTTDVIEAIGIVNLGAGSLIETDPGGSISVDGDIVSVLGTLRAPGGSISVSGASSYPVPDDLVSTESFALPTVYLGPGAVLDASGVFVPLPDPYDRNFGRLYPGGTIRVTGNILAEAGAVLDVSGTSAVFDFHPSRLARNEPSVPNNAGLNTMPWERRGQGVLVETDGGRIELWGSEMLFSDATLRGAAGGPSAEGGTLSISSGRFYADGERRTSADINLFVSQTGTASSFGAISEMGALNEILTGRADLAEVYGRTRTRTGAGFFSVGQFESGGFASLDLGYEFFEDAQPIAFGGNVRFLGPVNIVAEGFVRVAGGGVIQADAPVSISAPYVAVGQEFRPPLHPNDVFRPFTKSDPADPGVDHFFPPTSGPGSLRVDAQFVDIGTLSTLNIGNVAFVAEGGDIRGNGTLSVAGDILMRAAQIYPTTLGEFDIFAYDPTGGTSTVRFESAGTARTPLSVGGQLRVFASRIIQGGSLKAPLGNIQLGWDGFDPAPDDATIDAPVNRVVGTTATPPIATLVRLTNNSITSVSGIDFVSGDEIVFPFASSPSGLSFIDPSGLNVTSSGFPAGRVSIGGNSVVMAGGAVVDLRGGGHVFNYRWVQGNTGQVDILGTASRAWASGGEYDAGELVTHLGRTWSARSGIDPADFEVPPEPGPNQFWQLVPDSYAVLPGDPYPIAPYNAFNTGSNASALGGDPGFVTGSLRIGERVRLPSAAGLPAGTYTLLPRRYALLPGAYLIVPSSGSLDSTSQVIASNSPELKTPGHPIGQAVTEEGGVLIDGRTSNRFLDTAGERAFPVLQQFEVVSPSVLAGRAEYELYFASDFLSDAAQSLGLAQTQRLPRDSGSLAIHGNTGLDLRGRVLSAPAFAGRGSQIDLSSSAPITIADSAGGIAAAGSRLSAPVLNSWGAESLLVGALRSSTGREATLDVRTPSVTLANSRTPLRGADVIVTALESLTVQPGVVLQGAGTTTATAQSLFVEGDGVLIRASTSDRAPVTRTGITPATTALLTVGPGTSLSGKSVTVDSSYAMSIDPAARVVARDLNLAAGQISLFVDGVDHVLAGQIVDPHLVVTGQLLTDFGRANRLSLTSYSTLDLYGSGTFGSPGIDLLRIETAAIRGYDSSGPAVLAAREILISNPLDLSPPALPASAGGTLQLDTAALKLGQNRVDVAGFDVMNVTASGGVLVTSEGELAVSGDLAFLTPVLAGRQGASYSMTATGNLSFTDIPGSRIVPSGLGASVFLRGLAVDIGSDVDLPGGLLQARATAGDLSVTSTVDVSGREVDFYGLSRFVPAGIIDLESDQGDVVLGIDSELLADGAGAEGDAGEVVVRAPEGQLLALGRFSGAAASGRSGIFRVDAGSIADFNLLEGQIDAGGFGRERQFRVRTGDISLSGNSVVETFRLSADGLGGVGGNISVSGSIDASGTTGGSIVLIARGDLTLQSGAALSVAGENFAPDGKGGEIVLEAGASSDGVLNASGMLTLESGSVIDLSVADFVAGDFLTVGSSEFAGQFEGTLRLRAPRSAGGVNIASIGSNVTGGSVIFAEGVEVYDQTASGGVMDRALRDAIDADNAAFMAGEAGIRTTLLGGGLNSSLLVVVPGVEIINRTGDLILGAANPSGSSNIEARSTADWDLSGWRYGADGSPGLLVLRAQGDLIFNNTLSDGFDPVTASSTNGHSTMWLATPQAINTALPINAQHWSYRLVAGSDVAAADTLSTLSTQELDSLQPGKGSVLVGEYYPAIPNSSTGGLGAAVGSNGLTANTIRISTNFSDQGTRYEVIRTGTGDIEIGAGRDLELRNVFATIYTSGVALPDPENIYQSGDFNVPEVVRSSFTHPSQAELGAIQQSYAPSWTLAGGDVRIDVGGEMARRTLNASGELIIDTSRQIPTNWLYRRGFVDPDTGLFSDEGGVDDGVVFRSVTDPSNSTTWWIDFSNFFQGIGTLGGGDARLSAGGDIINIDVVAPTNARMAGIDPSTGNNLSPSSDNLLEHGGGDIEVISRRNISGGVYYAERGALLLDAGGEITTNEARSPSLYILGSTSFSPSIVESQNPAVYDPATWLPTTLFLGKASANVRARGDVLLGPTSNVFLLPQGLNNKFWYKTYFNTYSPDASVDVSSFGGSVTHRLSATSPSRGVSPILQLWMSSQNQFAGISSSGNASNFQPWLRLSELDVSRFTTVSSIAAPTLRSTAFAGDVRVVGDLNLFPSPTGTLELVASEQVVGLNPSGRALNTQGTPVTFWTYSSINLSDASPGLMPSPLTPIAYQSLSGIGRSRIDQISSRTSPFTGIEQSFAETGSFIGRNSSAQVKQALHSSSPLHAGDSSPVRIYARGGDITGLTLFSPKFTEIFAERDITDVAFYLQNLADQDVSIVSAGRDIVANNPNTELRGIAGDLSLGNEIGDFVTSLADGTTSTARAGDIQIGGPGYLEVLAGRNIDLGIEANRPDGTGVGITSIGRSRNPFLSSEGASLVVLAGVSGEVYTPAIGLLGSNLNLEPVTSADTPEIGAIDALTEFYSNLRAASDEFAETGSYDSGYAAIDELFGTSSRLGDLFARSRDIRTVSGGGISITVPGGGVALASDIIGNPLTPPGIVTEFGGAISIFTDGDVDIGRSRIFTLRGGDITIWSSTGDIAAGTAPKTVVTAPPTRVVIDTTSAAVQTDLGGLATGGGIGVLASVEGVEPGNVTLIAPEGTVDAGDAGIRATGDITIAAASVLNADNIAAQGTSVGVPSTPVAAAPNIAGLSSASSTTGATSAAAENVVAQSRPTPEPQDLEPSIIEVEILGYGGGDDF